MTQSVPTRTATVERMRTSNLDTCAVLEREVVATVVRYPIPLLQKVADRRAVERPFIYTYGWRMEVGASTVHADDFHGRMHLV